MPPPLGGSSGSCPAVWSISHHKGYCSRLSTVRPPRPCGLSCRGHSAWQATPSWTVYRLACHRLLPWLWVTFAMITDAAWPGSDQWPWSTAPAPGPVGRPGCPGVSNPWGVGSFLSLSRTMCSRCPGPLGSCSLVCLRGLLCFVCVVPGHFAPVHRCARSVWCVACAVSRAPWLPITSVPAGCVVLRVRYPGQLGSCLPVRMLHVLLCVRGVLGHLADVYRCACSVCCFGCAVSWATWLLFTGVPARFVVLCLRCPRPLGSSSPVCPLRVLCCVCGVLGSLAPAHRCARWVCCVACAVSWATWLLFTGALALCVALRARCPGPLGSCSPGCLLCLLFCTCGGHLAPVLRCARSACCFVCALSWAFWLLFTSVPGRGVPSLCCPPCTRVCGVLALVAPVHRCARCVRCACAIGGCVPLPPPLISFFLFLKLKKRKKQGRAYTAGIGTGSWCGGAIVLCPLVCVVGALAAVAPEGCGSRVLMYTGMGQGGFG